MARLPRLNANEVRMLGAGMVLSAPGVVEKRRNAPRPPRTGDLARTDVLDVTRVLGLDLAHLTGWALLVDGRPTEHGTFTVPDRSKGEALAHWHGRQARRLGEQVGVLVSAHRPDVLAYEYPDGYRRAWSGGTKGREFVVAAALGRLQGFLVALWPQIGGDVRLVAVSTTEAKTTAAGRVDASKAQVRWSLITYRSFDLARWSDDEVDAASIALAAREGIGS